MCFDGVKRESEKAIYKQTARFGKWKENDSGQKIQKRIAAAAPASILTDPAKVHKREREGERENSFVCFLCMIALCCQIEPVEAESPVSKLRTKYRPIGKFPESTLRFENASYLGD